MRGSAAEATAAAAARGSAAAAAAKDISAESGCSRNDEEYEQLEEEKAACSIQLHLDSVVGFLD